MSEERPLAVITGASSGIGAELARVLAERGYDCVISARRAQRLEELASELRDEHRAEVHVVAADLSTRGGARKLFDDVMALERPVDFLANNAGFGIYGKFAEQPVEKIEEMIQLNITSLTTLTRLFVAPMVERGRGRILQVASVGAFQPSPLYAVYSATKSYVRDFSQAIHFELRGTGVSVTTMCPGLTVSEFHEKAEHLKPKYMDTMMMSARSVAQIGVKAAERGKSGVTPGVANKLMEWSVAWTPRPIATWAAGVSMQAKRDEAPALAAENPKPAPKKKAKKKKAAD